MTLQQLICLGVEMQLLETGFVFVLGNKDKHELATQESLFSSACSSASLHRQHCVKSETNKNHLPQCRRPTQDCFLALEQVSVSQGQGGFCCIQPENLSHGVSGSLRRSLNGRNRGSQVITLCFGEARPAQRSLTEIQN